LTGVSPPNWNWPEDLAVGAAGMGAVLIMCESSGMDFSGQFEAKRRRSGVYVVTHHAPDRAT
jgi:hypothetical protein